MKEAAGREIALQRLSKDRQDEAWGPEEIFDAVVCIYYLLFILLAQI